MLEELDFIAHWLVFLLCTSSSFYMRVCRVRACVARAHCSMQASMLCGAQNSFVLKRLVYILKLKIGWLATTTRPWASSARFKRTSAQRRQISIQEDLWRMLLYLPALSFLLCHNLTAFSKVQSTIQKCFGKDQSSITFASPLTVCFLYKCLGRKKNKWEDYYSSSFQVTMLMFCFSAALPQKKSKKKRMQMHKDTKLEWCYAYKFASDVLTLKRHALNRGTSTTNCVHACLHRFFPVFLFHFL